MSGPCKQCAMSNVKKTHCMKIRETLCKDCCIKSIKLIGKCPWWDMCW